MLSGFDWGRLLFIAVAFLPLPFLRRHRRHRQQSNNNSCNNRNRSTNSRPPWTASLPFLLLLLLPLPIILSLSDRDGEIQQLKLRLSQLEFIIEDNTKMLQSRNLQLHENSKLIEGMEQNIHFLQNSVSMIKTSEHSSTFSEEMVKMMEEEVQLLWDESRKNNFNYHVLESKAYEEEVKIDAFTSEVEKMQNIVTEQWVQIQQLEQALQTMKIMTSRVHKNSKAKVHKKKTNEWTILKFLKGVRHRYLSEAADLPDTFFLGNYISKSFISRAYGHLNRICSAAKRWHHELQGLVKSTLEINQCTALNNEEIIFFVASAIIIIPIISICYLL